MKTPYIEKNQLELAKQRNEAFWKGQLEDYPLMWIYAENALPTSKLPEPADDDSLWTDVNYVIAAAEQKIAGTYFAGDSLPTHNPWLGPDQFAAWLGADMTLEPREYTSWIKPFITDPRQYLAIKLDPENKWWKLYLKLLKASCKAGDGKWATCYPDLHTGIDGLCAIRGPQNFMLDMLEHPEEVHAAMDQMTSLWKLIVEETSKIIFEYGQGSSNWTGGWSSKKFLCIGQNDFTCMISPQMFDEFCFQDNVRCCDAVDYSLYHLDGPDALKHLPKILSIESLTAVQWIQGAGQPLPSKWLDVLKIIQRAGKSVQLIYRGSHGGDADILHEIDVLCRNLDITKLFIVAAVQSISQANRAVEYAKNICLKKECEISK